MKKPIINTAVQILGKMAMVGISLITTGILTRKLGLESYGNFILISSLFVFLDSLADFGTKTIGVREIVKDEKNEVMGHIFNLRMIMATIAFGLGLTLVWSFKGLEGIRAEATVAMLMIFLTSIAGYWEIIFQSRLRMDLKVIMDLCFPTAFLIWLWWWKGEINLMTVFGVYLAARVISLGAGFWLVREHGQGKIKKFDWKELRKLWKMTWPMGVFLIMFATYDRAIDSLLIQNFLGASQVAWYGLAYKVYGVLVQPAYFYVNSIFPIMASTKVSQRKLFWTSLWLLTGGAIILVAIVYMAAPWMIGTLAGEAYGPSVAVLRILIVATLFSYAGHLAGFTLIARGGQREMLKLGAVALALNLVLNIVFIPRFGILAAAWITVITEMVDCGLMGWFLYRKVINR